MDFFKQVAEWLQGKKSYFVVGALVIIGALSSEGLISPDTTDFAYRILSPLLGATMGAKLDRFIAAVSPRQ